jgi:hypothetical protein
MEYFSEAFRARGEAIGEAGRIRDLHSQQQGIDPEFWRALPAGREDSAAAFVESTINQVVSRRFAKQQQMHWTLRRAHLLLQTRTTVVNNEFEGVFRGWYPRFRPQAA